MAVFCQFLFSQNVALFEWKGARDCHFLLHNFGTFNVLARRIGDFFYGDFFVEALFVRAQNFQSVTDGKFISHLHFHRLAVAVAVIRILGQAPLQFPEGMIRHVIRTNHTHGVVGIHLRKDGKQDAKNHYGEHRHHDHMAPVIIPPVLPLLLLGQLNRFTRLQALRVYSTQQKISWQNDTSLSRPIWNKAICYAFFANVSFLINTAPMELATETSKRNTRLRAAPETSETAKTQ